MVRWASSPLRGIGAVASPLMSRENGCRWPGLACNGSRGVSCCTAIANLGRAASRAARPGCRAPLSRLFLRPPYHLHIRMGRDSVRGRHSPQGAVCSMVLPGCASDAPHPAWVAGRLLSRSCPLLDSVAPCPSRPTREPRADAVLVAMVAGPFMAHLLALGRSFQVVRLFRVTAITAVLRHLTPAAAPATSSDQTNDPGHPAHRHPFTSGHQRGRRPGEDQTTFPSNVPAWPPSSRMLIPDNTSDIGFPPRQP